MSKLLVLDLETRPGEAYIWDAKQPQHIGIEQIIAPSAIIAVGAKWVGDPKPFYRAVQYRNGVERPGQRLKMLRSTHDLLAEADAVITFNGDAFDLPKLRGEFAQHGLPPLHKVTSIDVRRTTSAMGFLSGRLAFVAPLLGCERKHKHDGFTLWADYLRGDKAAESEMRTYNLQDVIVLEQVYEKVKAHIRNHPYLGTGVGTCPVCDSAKVTSVGKRRTRVSEIEQFRCGACAHTFEGPARRVVQTLTARAEKRCPRCGETKPLTAFHLNRSAADGRDYACRPCTAKRKAAYLQTPRGRERHAVAGWRRRQTPKGKACHAAATARYARTPKGKASQARRAARYYASPQGKARIAAYDRSPKRKAYWVRRRQTPEYKAYQVARNARLRAERTAARAARR